MSRRGVGSLEQLVAPEGRQGKVIARQQVGVRHEGDGAPDARSR
jgi:hypothetical protein